MADQTVERHGEKKQQPSDSAAGMIEIRESRANTTDESIPKTRLGPGCEECTESDMRHNSHNFTTEYTEYTEKTNRTLIGLMRLICTDLKSILS